MIEFSGCKKIKVLGYPSGPAIANTGTLEVSQPDICIYESTAGQSYIAIESSQIRFYNQRWLKLYLDVIDDTEIYDDGTDLIVTDGTTTYKFLGGSQIVFQDNDLTILNNSGTKTEYI